MSVVFYKIRHKASGLFYKPSKDTHDINLSKLGKIYARQPNKKHMGSIRLGFGVVGATWGMADREHRLRIKDSSIMVEFNPDDWELLKFYTISETISWS